LVYEEKRYTLRQVVNILDADFEGYEDDRKLFISVEKYGNNCPEVDDIRYRLEKYINDTAHEIGEEAGLDYYTVASVNPGGITIGPRVAASADGRRCGEPMALGNSPQPGTDVSGLTAMLLSATKTDPANGGVVTNMNMSRKTIVENREQVKNAFLTYFDMGGLQLNIHCFSKGDLEKALENPQEYRNLIVRVSGYSARFVDLDPITQKAIMARTLY
jgi:pyruvate-formate lyase